MRLHRTQLSNTYCCGCNEQWIVVHGREPNRDRDRRGGQNGAYSIRSSSIDPIRLDVFKRLKGEKFQTSNEDLKFNVASKIEEKTTNWDTQIYVTESVYINLSIPDGDGRMRQQCFFSPFFANDDTALLQIEIVAAFRFFGILGHFFTQHQLPLPSCQC
jgi:hypothetical protein